MYQEIILDHYRNPHGRGLREPFDAESSRSTRPAATRSPLRVQLDGGEGSTPRSRTSRTRRSAARSARRRRRCSPTCVVGHSRRGGLRDPRGVPGDGAGPRHRSSRTRTCSATASRSPAWPRYPARVKCALLGWMAFKDAVARAQASEAQASAARPEEQHEPKSTVVAGCRRHAGAAPAPAATRPSVDDLEEAMRDVVDPELGINVVDLGLVYGDPGRPSRRRHAST